MQKKQLDDAELLKLICKNDSKGMKYLMDCYTGLIYCIVEGKLKGHQQDIEECVSDVFIEFYNKLDSINLEKGSIKTYLATMASRRAIDRFRQLCAVKSDATENLEAIDEGITRSPEDDILESERKKMILEVIDHLGEPDNDFVFRRYFLSQSVNEIAEFYGMKSNSVGKRIQRALKVLREKLEEYYYDERIS